MPGLKPRLTAVLILLFLFAAFRTGLVKGVQDRLADPTWGRVQFAVGSAITSMKHGGHGYTIAGPVKSLLEYGGLTGDPAVLKSVGLKFPGNLRNPAVINAAIRKAADFPYPINLAKDVTGNGGDDIGMVDYVRLSFALFGFNMLSFYLTYFVLLAISFSCAIAAFRNNLGALATFLVVAMSLSLLFGSSLLNPENDGILDPRFLSTLCVVPTLHLALILLTRAPLTRRSGALVLFQASVIVFAYWIRSSALWAVLALLVLGSLLCVRWMRQTRRWELRRFWPLGILAGLVTAHLFYVMFALHPVYKSANERPYHGFWHAMVYALQMHPEWPLKYGPQFGNPTDDEQPEALAKRYLVEHPPANPDAIYLTPDRKYIRTGVTETYKRKAWFAFVASDPHFAFETYVFTNPTLICNSIAYHFASLGKLPRAYVVFPAIALLAMAALLMFDRGDLRQFRNGGFVLLLGLGTSLSYLVLTAPSYAVVADQFLLVLALLISTIVYVVARVSRWLVMWTVQRIE